MKTAIFLIALTLCASTITFAGPGGVKGMGHVGIGHVVPTHNHTINRTLTTTGRLPPGLEKEGLPPGLTKQGKTPAGWTKGEKEGWEDHGIFEDNDLGLGHKK